MKKISKIYLAGHTGLLGSALFALLQKQGFKNIITCFHAHLDLVRQVSVENFFTKEMPDYVILAAARVGGIHANTVYTAEFIYENLMIEANTMHTAYLHSVKKLLFLASACSYPRDCPQPIKEKYWMSGPLEPTNVAYGTAKIAGVALCQAYRKQYGSNFICAVPTNTYGPHDNFDPRDSHVIPALIRKFHEAKVSGAKQVILWGSGRPRREFIYVDDLAEASLFLMKNYNVADIINVGTGIDISVRRLAEIIKTTVGYKGRILFDASHPDGAPRKILDVSKIKKMGWRASVALEDGIDKTYRWYLTHQGNAATKK